MPREARKFLDPQAVRKLANLKLVARFVVEGFIAGLHRSPHRGFSVEFTEYREYTPGDDLRHLDWRVLARSDKYYVRLYEQETNLRAYLLLDVSGSMGYGSQGLTKLEYGCYLAASLAYLMTRQQDAVSLLAFAEDLVVALPPKNTPGHLNVLLKTLGGLQPQRGTRMSRTLHQLAENIRQRGLVVLISDLFDEPEEVIRGLKHFRHRGHEAIVFHLLDPDEQEFPFAGQIAFEDLEDGTTVRTDAAAIRRAYLAQLRAWQEHYQREFRRRRIDYVFADTSVPFDRFLAGYLAKRGRM
ncbi:MAG TPA: DUF58 domain-containing protein [Armatimonadetes bacterium]|nr:DUF58 domain-containing protein [Armatimonadota bacterium]